MAEGYGVPGSDYSQEMQNRQGPSYGKTELRDIGGGMQQYYALNMASGQWEPIGRPMPKPQMPGQSTPVTLNESNSIIVTTPNGTDVAFGPNQTVGTRRHVDEQPAPESKEPAPESKDFDAFRYQEEVQTLGGGKQLRDVYVLPMDTNAVYNPGYNEKSPGYDRLRVAKTETGIDLRQGYYDPTTNQFIITAPVKDLTPGQTGSIDNMLGLSRASTGGMTRGSFNADNTFFDKAVAAKVDDAQTKNSNSIADMVFGKKASAKDANAVDFSYGPNTNIIQPPKLTDLNVPRVTDNPMPSVGVGELRAGSNPIDVGKDPLGVVGIIIPRSSAVREKFFPETFEPSNQMKFNQKLLETGPKDPYWQTTEGKSLEQSARQELAFSVVGASPFAPIGLGRGVSVTKDIIPKIPVVRDAAKDIGEFSTPILTKITKPINELDYKADKIYTETRNKIIPSDTMRAAEQAKMDALRFEVYNAPKSRDMTESAKQIIEETPDIGYTYTGLGWKEHQKYTSAARKPGFYEVRDRATNDVIEFGNRPIVDVDTGVNIKPANMGELEGYGALNALSKREKKLAGFDDAVGVPKPMKNSFMDYMKYDDAGTLGGRSRTYTKTQTVSTRRQLDFALHESKTRSKMFSTTNELDAFTSGRQLPIGKTYDNRAIRAAIGLTPTASKQVPKMINPLMDVFANNKNKSKIDISTSSMTAQDTDIRVTPKLDFKVTSVQNTKQTVRQDTVTTSTSSPFKVPVIASVKAPRTPKIMGGGIPIVPVSIGAGGGPSRRKAGRKTKALWQNPIEQFNPLKNNDRKGVKKIKSNRKIKSVKGRR